MNTTITIILVIIALLLRLVLLGLFISFLLLVVFAIVRGLSSLALIKATCRLHI